MFKKPFIINSIISLKKNVLGASHADDLGYLFKTAATEDISEGSVEDKTIKRMVKLWTNFAKHGNPNPLEKDDLIDVKWEPVRNDQVHYLEIDADLKADMNPESERIRFWDHIFKFHPNSKL